MKKSNKTAVIIVILIVIVILSIMAALIGITYSPRNTIKRKMGIRLPNDCEIHNYELNYSIFYDTTVLAKVSMSKEEYTKFREDILEKYENNLSSDDISILAEANDEGDEWIYPANDSYLPINFEKVSENWWNIEVDYIDELFYVEKTNYRIGVRNKWIRRIYVVYEGDNVFLYLSEWK